MRHGEYLRLDVWALDESPKAYSEIVVSILRHKGVPMTHDEIREAFVQPRPCRAVPANILSFIVGSEEVAVRGRDGMFRLKEWAQFNNSPVRNLAVQCLMETEDKVHVSMIIAYLWKHGVQSTKEKVLHALRKDASGLVLDVGKDYFRYRR